MVGGSRILGATSLRMLDTSVASARSAVAISSFRECAPANSNDGDPGFVTTESSSHTANTAHRAMRAHLCSGHKLRSSSFWVRCVRVFAVSR